MYARPVRRTQAISPFGPGAMVDFPGPVSLIHCGIDAWPFSEDDPNHEEFKIDDEPRLAARLNVKYFVQPPDFRLRTKGENAQQHNLNLCLPFLRFPKWHVCPRCGLMYEGALHDVTAPTCEGPIGSGKHQGNAHPRRRTVQVRFIAACERGHLQDFPWWEWIFRTSTPERSGLRLRMISAGSASLAGVRILCEKEKNGAIQVVKRGSLRGAFHFELGEPSPFSKIEVVCRGENPALGIPSAMESALGCAYELYPLLRGSSNVYFPHVESAIYLPPRDAIAKDEVLEILEDHRVWSFLSLSAEAADNLVCEASANAALNRYYPDRTVRPVELAEAANRKLNGGGEEGFEPVESDAPEVAFRRQEFDLLSRDVEEGYSKKNLLVRRTDIAEYESPISKWFSQVSLVHKLRETRAFVGFSRIYPASELTPVEERSLLARDPKDWLPAVVVRGEGLFLQLREDRIEEWLDGCGLELRGRIGKLEDAWQRLITRRRSTLHRKPTIRFVLLHTFAHLLINQLVFECGYGTASLRERIYCADDSDHPMSAILVYTAAGDSEGSMGGLVRMGRPGRLEPAIRRALDKARWCSSDPVCMEAGGQGPEGCNLAACHSCALLPETACEEQNRLLDRGVVVGTLERPNSGYFSMIPTSA